MTHTKRTVPAFLWHLAREQEGMLTHSQLAGRGFTRNVIQRLLQDRVLWQVARGLYSLSPDPSWLALAWGGVLIGGPDSALCLESAGHLHGLCGQPRRIDVLVPRRTQRKNGIWNFHVAKSRPVGTPRRTGLSQTVLDLCQNHDADHVITVVSRAMGTGRVLPGELVDQLQASPAHPHRQLLLDIIGDVRSGVHSALERRFIRDVLLPHGLPVGQLQASVRNGEYTDAVYHEYNVAIELDGTLGHRGVGAFKDLDRDNRNMINGRFTLRFGWMDVVTKACAVAAMTERMLRSGGWPGRRIACPQCSVP